MWARDQKKTKMTKLLLRKTQMAESDLAEGGVVLSSVYTNYMRHII